MNHADQNDQAMQMTGDDVGAQRRALLAGIGGFAAGVVLSASSAQAGPLVPPPGPVSSTPGPEPRIAITGPAAIVVPGSYYLANDIVNTGSLPAITISAVGVTLDLNGFSISGGGAAVSISSNGPVVVRNGSIRSVTVGISSASLSNVVAEDVSVTSASLMAMSLGNGCLIRRCRAVACAGGLRVGSNSRVESSIASGNGGAGISAQTNSIVERCISDGNQDGISVSGNSVVRECSARGNSQYGIVAGSTCRVESCVVTGNQNSGVRVDPYSVVSGCTVSANGFHGIEVTGISVGFTLSTVIDSCSITINAVHGIFSGPGGNHLIRGCYIARNIRAGIVMHDTNHVIGNRISENNEGGISVNGGSNLLESNTLTSNSQFAWSFNSGANNNTALRNMIRGSAPLNSGTGNTMPVVPVSTAATGNQPLVNVQY